MTPEILAQLPIPGEHRFTLPAAVSAYAAAGYSSKLRWKPEKKGGREEFDDYSRWYVRFAKASYEAGQFQNETLARDALDIKVWEDACTLEAELLEDLPELERRRAIEHAVAQRIKDSAVANPDHHIAYFAEEYAERMMLCRTSGVKGIDDQGRPRVMWSFKCGGTKLCPDGNRANTRRVEETIADPVLDWKRARSSHRRVIYMVMTTPNVAAGQLKEGIAAIQERFRDWLDYKRPIKDVERAAFGYTTRKKLIKHWQPAKRRKSLPDGEGNRSLLPYHGAGIHGALVQLECPLAADGTWNIHLNVMLLVQSGAHFDFDYAKVRETWGYNVHIDEVKPGPKGLSAAVRELIKYPARMVAEKSADKASTRASEAPPMVEWPDDRLLEWLDASVQRQVTSNAQVRYVGSRWMASYGCLYGLEKPEREEAAPVQWMGTLNFSDAGKYCVDLTLDNNFSRSPRQKHLAAHELHQPGYRPPRIRPPPTFESAQWP